MSTPSDALCSFLGEPSASRGDELARLTDLVAPALREGDAVVAILPAWADEPIYRELQTVRSALDVPRLAIHRTTLPPLAAASLVNRLATLAERPGVGAGEVVASVAALEESTVAAAWLGSVARLRHPAPSVGLHLRSYGRRPAFAAMLDGDPRVERLRGPDALLPLPEPDDDVEREVVLGIGQGDVTLVERSLATRLPGAKVTRVPLGAISHQWWGTEKVIELAIHPVLNETISRLGVTSTSLARCDWCGEGVDANVCPFCGVARTDRTTQTEGADE